MILKSRIILICNREDKNFDVNDYATCVVVVDIYSDGDDVTNIAVVFEHECHGIFFFFG
jgi:hypothetical protein